MVFALAACTSTGGGASGATFVLPAPAIDCGSVRGKPNSAAVHSTNATTPI